MDWLECIWQQQSSPAEAAAFVLVVTAAVCAVASIQFVVSLLLIEQGRAALSRALREGFGFLRDGWNWIEPVLATVTLGTLTATIVEKNALIRGIVDDRSKDVSLALCAALGKLDDGHPLCSAAKGLSTGDIVHSLSGVFPDRELSQFVRDLTSLYGLDGLWPFLRTGTIAFLVLGVLLLAWRIGLRQRPAKNAADEKNELATTLGSAWRPILLLALCTGLLWTNFQAFTSVCAVAKNVMATLKQTPQRGPVGSQEALRRAAAGVVNPAVEVCDSCANACSAAPRIVVMQVPGPARERGLALGSQPPAVGFLTVSGSVDSDRSVTVQSLTEKSQFQRVAVPGAIDLPVGNYRVTSERDTKGQVIEIKRLETRRIVAFTPSAREPARLLTKPLALREARPLPGLADAISSVVAEPIP